MEIGLRGKFLKNSNYTLENANILSQIMSDTVPYNPELVEGISTDL